MAKRRVVLFVMVLVFCLVLLSACRNGKQYPDMNTKPGSASSNSQNSSGSTADTDGGIPTSPWEDILTYEAYLKMTAQEREAFYKSFENPEDFYTWHVETKAVYDAKREQNQLGQNGSIDMGEINPD